MAYDEHLAERVENVLKKKHVLFEAKKMMGGLCLMVNDKMAVGVVKGLSYDSASILTFTKAL